MNVDDLARILRRADALGAQPYVLDVLREIDAIDQRTDLPRWSIGAVQSAYLLTRTTDRGLDASVRDLLTTAATTIALHWRASLYVGTAIQHREQTTP